MPLKPHLFNRILTEIFSAIHLLATQMLESRRHYKLKRKKKREGEKKNKSNQQGDIYFISPLQNHFLPFLFFIFLVFPCALPVTLHPSF